MIIFFPDKITSPIDKPIVKPMVILIIPTKLKYGQSTKSTKSTIK